MAAPGEGILICYPDALETAQGRVDVIRALQRITTELGLGPFLAPKPDRYGWVRFPVAAQLVRSAMERAIPDWRERALFFPWDEIP